MTTGHNSDTAMPMFQGSSLAIQIYSFPPLTPHLLCFVIIQPLF